MPLFTSQFGDEQMAQYLDPSMEFRRKLGEQTTARMLNVGGGAISGNTLRGLEDYGQNLASTEYGNAFNRFQNERTNIYNTWPILQAWDNKRSTQASRQATNFAAVSRGIITGQAAAQAAGGLERPMLTLALLEHIGNYAMLNSLMNPAGGGAVTPPPGYGTTGYPGMGGGSGLTIRLRPHKE
jgi:hypothetical protein